MSPEQKARVISLLAREAQWVEFQGWSLDLGEDAVRRLFDARGIPYEGEADRLAFVEAMIAEGFDGA